jgi:RNA polymerase sigma-70 factor (ECF subfamily)
MDAELCDAEIIARVLRGETELFGILVDRYADEFARYAKYMTGNAEDAADVIQESLVRAFRSLRRCQDTARFKGWLFRIVCNQCKTHLSSRRRTMRPLEEAEELAAPDDPAADAEAADVRRRIEGVLQELPDEQREVLILKYVEGMSIPEMAETLSASVPALKMRLVRARRGLLAKLDGVDI